MLLSACRHWQDGAYARDNIIIAGPLTAAYQNAVDANVIRKLLNDGLDICFHHILRERVQR